MAAPQIPKLNTLLRGGGRGRGREQGSTIAPPAPSSEEGKARNDRIVQQTDQDASVSRLSAVQLGYLDDPFASLFVSSEGQRRFPIINRGTYVRTSAIDDLVVRFLSTNLSQKKQILSLGAGSDTRFFRLKARFSDENAGPGRPNFIYNEFDFPANTAQKVSIINRSRMLSELISSPLSVRPDALDSPDYNIHPIDLRTLDPSIAPSALFKKIERALPTLIISECCLIYLVPAAADTVALYFTKHLFPETTPLGLILYEPINPHDPFGKIMVSNLAARGIMLQTLRRYGTLEAQAARMKVYGFDDSRGADVNELWAKVQEAEKERVAGLEMVDEVEEWELLAGHYSVIWGWREGDEQGTWDAWKNNVAMHMAG